MPPGPLIIEFFRLRPERETRIPGLARKRAPRSAGPVGGNEAMSRIPMAGRTLKGSLKRRAVQSAATELIRSLVCRASECARLNRRWW